MKLFDFLRSRIRPSNSDSIQQYLDSGRLPWSPGYDLYRWRVIQSTLKDVSLMNQFRQGEKLSQGYGQFLDERVVEYPWLLSHLEPTGGRLLDAGSTLNNLIVLNDPALKAFKKFILTLAPEKTCYWDHGVSYIYSDLRELLFRDNYFDVVVCISTLEHVGMDNTVIYTNDEKYREFLHEDYLNVIREFWRVLKPGGKCYLTVPFGQYQYDVFQQQFNTEMLMRVKKSFGASSVHEYYYKYSATGWNTASMQECADCKYFNVHKTRYFDRNSTLDFDSDKAAAARAIAAWVLTK